MDRVIGWLGILLGVGVIVFITIGTIHAIQDADEFNNWTNECYKRGGYIAVTRVDTWKGEYYDCFVGGEKVILR